MDGSNAAQIGVKKLSETLGEIDWIHPDVPEAFFLDVTGNQEQYQ